MSARAVQSWPDAIARGDRLPPGPILVVRPDGLGDVILSLPVFAELRARFPGTRLALLASPAVAPLLAEHPWIDEIIIEREHGLRGFAPLLRAIEKSAFAAAIVLRPRLRYAAMLAAARIPWRVGTAYRAYSWLFTHRVREHRRGSGRHEIDLNLDLLEPLGRAEHAAAPIAAPIRRPWVPVHPVAREEARALVRTENPFVVLHPGSRGSAPDWPPEHFATLGRALSRDHGIDVVVTGIGAEAPLVDRVTRAVPGALSLAGRTSLPVLAALLAEARLVVAASTGPLHLAAAVGTPIVGIYPAKGDMSATRWGPRAVNAIVLEAGIEPGRSAKENGGAHGRTVDLASVTPEVVLGALASWTMEARS